MNNNRIIKFRVWIEEEKRFRYCDYIPTMGFVWCMVEDHNLELGENYPQQFTGRYDQNGKEIYEGDILKCDNRSYNKYIEVNYNIHMSAFTFENRLANEFSKFNSFIVVGNVFENAELLKNYE